MSSKKISKSHKKVTSFKFGKKNFYDCVGFGRKSSKFRSMKQIHTTTRVKFVFASEH